MSPVVRSRVGFLGSLVAGSGEGPSCPQRRGTVTSSSWLTAREGRDGRPPTYTIITVTQGEIGIGVLPGIGAEAEARFAESRLHESPRVNVIVGSPSLCFWQVWRESFQEVRCYQLIITGIRYSTCSNSTALSL